MNGYYAAALARLLTPGYLIAFGVVAAVYVIGYALIGLVPERARWIDGDGNIYEED